MLCGGCGEIDGGGGGGGKTVADMRKGWVGGGGEGVKTVAVTWTNPSRHGSECDRVSLPVLHCHNVSNGHVDSRDHCQNV